LSWVVHFKGFSPHTTIVPPLHFHNFCSMNSKISSKSLPWKQILMNYSYYSCNNFITSSSYENHSSLQQTKNPKSNVWQENFLLQRKTHSNKSIFFTPLIATTFHKTSIETNFNFMNLMHKSVQILLWQYRWISRVRRWARRCNLNKSIQVRKKFIPCFLHHLK